MVAKPGDLVHMPIGQPHAVKIGTNETAKMMTSFASAGLEGYFFEFAQPLEGEPPPKPTQEEIEKLMAAAPR